MSLSSELQNPNSIISRFLNSIIDPVESQVMMHHWNIKLGNAKTLKLQSDVSPSLVGTAFDYAFRWTIANHFDPNSDLIGMMGAIRADNRQHQYHVEALKQLIQRANQNSYLRAPVSIILSWYERIVRERNYQLVDKCFKQLSTSVQHTIRMLTSNVPLSEFSDVLQLMETIPHVWGSRLRKPYILNPILPNSTYVGGADADWIVDGILYDCKCSWRGAPFTKDHLRQVMAYALLDWDDKLNLRGIGWYYARQQIIIEYPIEEILPDIDKKRAALKALFINKHRTNPIEAELDDILRKHHGTVWTP